MLLLNTDRPYNDILKFIKDFFLINQDQQYFNIIPGEEANTDLSTSVAFIKNRPDKVLLGKQSSGLKEIWGKNQLEI